MIIIPLQEIKELIKGCYIDDGEEILVKHSVYEGEREFALVLIEKCLGLLSRNTVNDNYVIQYLQGLLSLTIEENAHYESYLNTFVEDREVRRVALEKERLRVQDLRVLKELMSTNMAEYLMKGEYQSCCYSAMTAFFLTMYCILLKKIDFVIGHIDMIADLDDELDCIKIYEAKEQQDFIIVEWHSTNKINSMYMLYKNQFAGLEKESVLDLVAADVIEEDYYYKDERFSIAPSILVKQYCSIIEHEINAIIQLLNLPNKPNRHLMWNKMKIYVKENSIELTSTSYELQEVLEALHDLRNKAAHGEVITKEEYAVVSNFKNLGLFAGISIEKLKLRQGKISPTIDEIQEYMGLLNL